MSIINFREGFIFQEFKFGIKDQKLYRLPIIKNGRSYCMREVPVIQIAKNIRGYRIIRQKKSLRQIEQMVEKVDFKVKIDQCLECLK